MKLRGDGAKLGLWLVIVLEGAGIAYWGGVGHSLGWFAMWGVLAWWNHLAERRGWRYD